MTANALDLLVIGGGVNGAGIARDAAGRGLKTMLVEREDLASHTSSSSTKIVHGGLRYLEQYEFRLVREALAEREVLLAAAPHIIWPLQFVLPHAPHLRPAWMIRAGLFLYDHLAKRRKLPGSGGVDFRKDTRGAPLRNEFIRGFHYADCWVEDARLVVLNAMDAQMRGATIATRTACISARREGSLWQVTLRDQATGRERQVTARAIANAAGPWVGAVLGHVAGLNSRRNIRLVKGSHIIVPRLYEGDHAYILQNADRRIVFTIPYEGDYTLIGTTDEELQGDPGKVDISEGETDYLIDITNLHFRTQISRKDIVWTYAGVRPLFDDGTGNPSAVTRDYALDVDSPRGAAPLLSAFGGKITTFRCLAEDAVDKLAPLLGNTHGAWTAGVALPGGDIPDADFEAFLVGLAARFPDHDPALLHRLARAYGTRADVILASMKRPGAERLIAGDLSVAELEYLVAHEYAREATDVLWRRSKLGLHLDEAGRRAVENWFTDRSGQQQQQQQQ